MLGQQAEYDVVPYFWSDLADWTGMEYVGPASDWDEVWWRGSREEGKFTAWYVKGSRLAAALTVGRSDDLNVATRLLREKTDIGSLRARLEDPNSDISELG
jgi:3-phenylpropionate/trans-cinnamate dioxygenase ferredoxin reductase subunit